MSEEEPDRRACESCGYPLSRYNRGTRCASCQRTLLDLYGSMPVVPAQVWADKDVRVALANWDFRAFCRLLRQRSGLRQEDCRRPGGWDRLDVSLARSMGPGFGQSWDRWFGQ